MTMNFIETLLSMLGIYFLLAGSLYFTIGIVEWWNGFGYDENGNPK